MSKLLEELAYIFEWMEYTVPELADRYNPGLTRQQIDGFRLRQWKTRLY